MKAIPDEGASFIKWTVEHPDLGIREDIIDAEFAITLDENTIVYALFSGNGTGSSGSTSSAARLYLITEGNGRIECEYESDSLVPIGTLVQAQAIADEGYVFSHWVMNRFDTEEPIEITEENIEFIFDCETFLTACFVEDIPDVTEWELAVTVEGSGALNGTPAGLYPDGTDVTLTAVPYDTWRVIKWIVTNLDTNETVITETNETEFSLALHQNTHITVVLEPSFIVDARANDESLGTVTGGGVYYASEEVTLTATPANEQVTFTGWYVVKDGTIYFFSANSQISFPSGNDDITFVAVFTGSTAEQYVINATAEPAEGGIVTGNGFYNAGASVALTATANDGYIFTGWYENGLPLSTEATLIFTAESDRTIKARFTSNAVPAFTVTLQANPANGGVLVGSGMYNSRDAATVTAKPADGFIFKGWTLNGEIVSTGTTYTFVVESDVTLTAEFTDTRTKLAIITNPADAEQYATETASFSVTATGDGLTYQWQQSSRSLARSTNWVNIDGATLPTYQVTAKPELDGTQYRCIVTDKYGNILISDAATLTVLENPILPPTGDGFNAALWLALMVISTAGVILLRKRVRG